MIAIRDNVVKINSINYESVLSDYINKNQTGILAFSDDQNDYGTSYCICYPSRKR
jgi:hypothetical protein